MSGYVVLLALFGVIPVIYSLYLALTRPTGGFAGLRDFIQTAEDYRFVPAVEHVAAFLVLWLVSLTVFVVLLALVVHRLAAQRGKAFIRFAYYIPGALAGASSVLLWLFVLNPSVSPVSVLVRAFGGSQFTSVIAPGHLPIVFTIIAFWTGAGGWILILYGALNTIPADLLEAARVDGAGPLSTAWHVQLPLIGKWITYMLILSLAAGHPAVRGAAAGVAGQLRRGQQLLLGQPARLPVRVHPEQLQRGGGDLHRPADRRAGLRRDPDLPRPPVPDRLRRLTRVSSERERRPPGRRAPRPAA